MIYTVIGDPHTRPDNLDKIDHLFDIVEAIGNMCIILGDLFDTKEVVRGKCLNLCLKRMKESKLHFVVLVGNHDWFNLECKEHSLEPLKELPNVLVVDKLTYEGNIAFLPYTHDVAQFRDLLGTIKSSKYKYLFCHADIKGFDYGNGYISENGLDSEDFKGFKVISGHYHKFQQDGNITYLGTPFSHSFGESNQTKVIGIFDSDTGNLETVDMQQEFPLHKTVEIDCDKHQELTFTPNHGNIYRVILYGSQENINSFNRLEGFKYIEKPSNISENDTGISETYSTTEQFIIWATNKKNYSDELIDLGLEILENV